MRLSLHNIIRWEQLSNCTFSKLSLENEEHLDALIYVVTKPDILFESFKLIKQSKAYQNEAIAIASEYQQIFQYQTNVEGSENKTNEDGKLSDLAFFLISKGLDPQWVLHELSLIDIPMLIDAINNEEKNRMESNRLFAYLQMLPHIDSKLVRSPTDILPFPWEIEQQVKEKEKEVEESINLFKVFEQYGKQ